MNFRRCDYDYVLFLPFSRSLFFPIIENIVEMTQMPSCNQIKTKVLSQSHVISLNPFCFETENRCFIMRLQWLSSQVHLFCDENKWLHTSADISYHLIKKTFCSNTLYDTNFVSQNTNVWPNRPPAPLFYCQHYPGRCSFASWCSFDKNWFLMTRWMRLNTVHFFSKYFSLCYIANIVIIFVDTDLAMS